ELLVEDRRERFAARVRTEAAAALAELAERFGHLEGRDPERARLRRDVDQERGLAKLAALVRDRLRDEHDEVAHLALGVRRPVADAHAKHGECGMAAPVG